MSLIRCDKCDRPVDTDTETLELFSDGEDSFNLCEACAESYVAEQDAEMRAARAEYNAAPLSERNPVQYRQDMIDAGRGHLLPETWEQKS